MKFPNRGLYAITQTEGKTMSTILAEIEAVLKGGAVVIQYRDKQPKNAIRLATELLKLCHAYDVALIINDNIDLAKEIGADGVHLGQDDLDEDEDAISNIRHQLGQNSIIGISCYNNAEKAIAMQTKGANYVAFGRFFPSNSKPLAKPADLQTLHTAKAQLSIPIVAIGGILPENAPQLLDAGADLLAVIGGLFVDQPELAARRFKALFD